MRGIFTGMLVLGLLFIITFMKFTTLHIRACESFTALNEQYCRIIQVSAHVQMDGWIKSGHHDVCIYDQSIQDLRITQVIIARRPTHHWSALPGKLKMGNHRTINRESV